MLSNTLNIPGYANDNQAWRIWAYIYTHAGRSGCSTRSHYLVKETCDHNGLQKWRFETYINVSVVRLQKILWEPSGNQIISQSEQESLW